MQKQTLIVGVLLLIIGLGGGYWIGQNKHIMGMSDIMKDMNVTLHGKTGDELDKAFVDEMIIHHEGAVEMARTLLKSTARLELIQLANNIITAQTGEIEMMKQWQIEWFSR